MAYWQSVLNRQTTRRRALASASTAAVGLAFLAACGGSSDVPSGNKSSLITAPIDTSKQAKRGGTLKRSVTADPATLDAHAGGITLVSYLEFAYSRLFNVKSGHLAPSQGEIEPDLAESWEWSPDHLQLTAKLRPNIRFHNLAPVNGRAADIDDFAFTWKRYSAVGSDRSTIVNSVNPDAPIVSVTTPDSRMVVTKFKEPLVYVQTYLARRAYLNLIPKEAENPSVLDLRSKMVGTGPLMLASYQPSIGLTFKRHAEYWDKERPYVDQVEYPIVSEYAAALAQFRSGNIHTFPVSQEEVLGLKNDLPALSMYDAGIVVDGRRSMFGWENSALRDKRVRQALSMTIARDDWLNVSYNTGKFESQGLTIDKRWNTSLTATETNTGWWLDPQGKDFGPNAKYFQHDVAEAKKLLAAAGYTDGVEITSNHFTTAQQGTDFVQLIELWESMAAEAGFRHKKNIITYNDYLRNLRDSNGKFSGVTYKSGPPAPTSDPVDSLSYEFSSRGGIGFHGFDVGGKGDGSGDPYVEGQLNKARVEFDTEKRRAIIHDLQRHLADQQYHIRWPGGATSFSLLWPAVRNVRVFRAADTFDNVVTNTTWWLDETQPPLKKD